MVNTSLETGKDSGEIADQLSLYFAFFEKTLFTSLEKAVALAELPPEFDKAKYASFLLGSLQGLSVYAKFHSKRKLLIMLI